jgi:hypothetical protein
MLIAERAVRVYGRTDGGDGGMLAADGQALLSHNAPPADLPKKWWNLALVRSFAYQKITIRNPMTRTDCAGSLFCFSPLSC